jgi:pimeloyl-ACP methyl ester carboxylesterase
MQQKQFKPEIPETRLMKVMGAKVRYADVGKGRVVVLLHGFLENLEVWFGNKFAQELAEHYRVIAIDLPGHGKSECVGYVHRMEKMAGVVKAVMDELGLRRYTMVGHSMGGYVTLAFAEKYPQNLTGFCLFHSTSTADSEAKKIERERAIRLVKKSPVKYTNALIANLLAVANVRYFKAEIAWLKRMAAKTKPQGIIACLEGMKIRKNRENVLRYSQVPVLFIAGQRDNVIPLEVSEKQKDLAADQRYVALEKCGHMGFLEQKEIALKKLRAFCSHTFTTWVHRSLFSGIGQE